MAMKGKIFDRPIAFHRCFVDLTGSVKAALMLSQACYWALRAKDARFYKSMAEWKEETGLSRREQESARAVLRTFPFWREEDKRFEHRLYYTVDVDGVAEAVERARTLPGAVDENGEGVQPPMFERGIPECPKAPSGNGGNGHPGVHETDIRYKEQRLPETTSEITTPSVQRAERSEPSISRIERPMNGLFGKMRGYAERTWRERFGAKPTWVKKDFVQLARLLRCQGELGLEEFSARWDRYLADDEPFVARQGYSLAFFCSRFDNYIRRSGLDVPDATPYED